MDPERSCLKGRFRRAGGACRLNLARVTSAVRRSASRPSCWVVSTEGREEQEGELRSQSPDSITRRWSFFVPVSIRGVPRFFWLIFLRIPLHRFFWHGIIPMFLVNDAQVFTPSETVKGQHEKQEGNLHSRIPATSPESRDPRGHRLPRRRRARNALRKAPSAGRRLRARLPPASALGERAQPDDPRPRESRRRLQSRDRRGASPRRARRRAQRKRHADRARRRRA